MKSKKEMLKTFINKNKIFCCPICNNSLYVDDDSIKCLNNHNYNISKKGFPVLVNDSNLKKSKTYDKTLFINRRDFINSKAYKKLYIDIIKSIKNYINDDTLILDLGCGEGSHINLITKELQDIKVIGIDYSKFAIQMATDYIKENTVFIVADVNNIPVKDKSIDIILDILSPFNNQEIKRILKTDGIIIKIVPNKDYLIELRKDNNILEYSNIENVSANIFNYFEMIDKIEVNYKFSLNDENKQNLIEMTPLTKNKKSKNINFDYITIDLIVYILKINKDN